VSGLIRLTGSVVCLVAVLVTLGGHWLALQSLAWARMLADFSRRDGVVVALAKTFDGQHPCPLCLRIQQGRQQEQREGRNAPGGVKPDRESDLFCESRPTAVPMPPTLATEAVPFVARPHSDFIDSPPTPPPRRCPRVTASPFRSCAPATPLFADASLSRIGPARGCWPATPRSGSWPASGSDEHRVFPTILTGFPDARFRVAPIVIATARDEDARHLEQLVMRQWRQLDDFYGLGANARETAELAANG
jgi:hypothetical protein